MKEYLINRLEELEREQNKPLFDAHIAARIEEVQMMYHYIQMAEIKEKEGKE